MGDYNMCTKHKSLKKFWVSTIAIIGLCGTVSCSSINSVNDDFDSTNNVVLDMENHENYFNLVTSVEGYDGNDGMYNKCSLSVMVSGLSSYSYCSSAVTVTFYSNDSEHCKLLNGDEVFTLNLSSKGNASYSKIVALDNSVSQKDIESYIDFRVTNIVGEALRK
jgi:hypothetical protein